MYKGTKEHKWILLVDDEEEVRSSLKEVIQLQFGSTIKFVEARDGLEATTKINYQKFDCILTDLAMPKKEGEAFIHSVRSNPLNDVTPVIVISGSPNLEKIVEEFEFVEALPKPYKMNALNELLEKNLKIGNNKNRVSANVLNNIILSVEKFVSDLHKGDIAQSGALKVKNKGELVEQDFVSTIQVKIGSVTNTFSIMANKKDVESLFSEKGGSTQVNSEKMMQTMSFVILNHVMKKASLMRSSSMKASYIQHNKEILNSKRGLIIGLGNENLQLGIFATSE